MRAVVLNGAHDVSVETVDDPELSGPDGIVVEVTHTAICGSDLHLYHGQMPSPGVHLGHEFIGRVAEAGADVRSVSTGDRVLVSGVIGCGACRQCTNGWPMRCLASGSQVFGTSLELPGGQAEFVAVPAADTSVQLIPDGVTDEQAVLLTDILPTGYLGARRADIAPGSTVAVIGLGPVGICALRAAMLFSPARILAIDPVAHRRAHAERLGAEVIDPSDGGGGAAQLLEATGGRGVDSVIEAVGRDDTINEAIMAVAPGGTVSVVGVSTNMAHPFPMVIAMFKGITFRICVADIPHTWETLIPLVVSGKLHPEDVFTHRMGLSEAPEAYRIFDAKDDAVMKVLLDPRS
ncbi:MAG: alcohol dehydrogenase catalytic domain-containing protein [Acidimicrobiales bacterium]